MTKNQNLLQFSRTVTIPLSKTNQRTLFYSNPNSNPFHYVSVECYVLKKQNKYEKSMMNVKLNIAVKQAKEICVSTSCDEDLS